MLKVSLSIRGGAAFDMSRITIDSSLGSYSIQLLEGDLLASEEYAALIIDENVPVPNELVGLPTLRLKANEGAKTLSTVEDICSFLLDAGCTRQGRILAVGGGFIQDVVTLSAAIFMRGIKWDFAPTTLIGMADSCIGGKSSINIASGKNAIGNFYPPSGIFISTSFLKSLPRDTVLAGIFESVKIIFAKNPNDFGSVLAEPALSGDASPAQWLSLIEKTLQAKKWFVEIDEFDRNERQMLNFGHTFGHALEASTRYRVQHGIAVGFGMLAALEFSGNNNQGAGKLLDDFCLSALKTTSASKLLVESQIDWGIFDQSILRDKKNSASEIALVLPSSEGNLNKIFVPKDQSSLAGLRSAMQHVIRKVSEDEVL